MQDIKWIKSGSRLNRVEGEFETVSKVPVGVYEIELTMTGWYLKQIANKFTFPYKLYDLQNDFLTYLKKTYDNTKGNLGILYNGHKGSGKTVCAKVFANMLNLPVIIVKSMGDQNDNLFSFLSSFNFDCIFFFDEFEKQFNDCDSCILQFMDGIYSSNYRRVFLLTTNKLTVNENLLSRPSRIRYVKEFGNLEEHTVREYLADNLINQDATEELIGYIDTLTISTIDILKTIVEEVNIHGIESFLEIKKFFNVETANFKYTVIRSSITLEAIKAEGNYTVDDFLKEKKMWENRYTARQELEAKMASLKNQKDKDKLYNNWVEENKRRGDFDYDYIVLEKPWDKHIVGKDVLRGEKVISVYPDKNTIVTVYENDICFYFIKDSMNPSLYTNPFYGQFD